MRPILFLFVLLLTQQLLAQQTPGKQKRIGIGNTGATYLNYCETPFTTELTPDSSVVYSTECPQGDFTYGLICVSLKRPYEDLTMAEDMVIAYLDFLKENFTITRTAGYSRGYRLNATDSVRGVTDHWEDSDGDHWKIRGWTDGKIIGVLYLYSQKPIPESRANDYFNGFRFRKIQ